MATINSNQIPGPPRIQAKSGNGKTYETDDDPRPEKSLMNGFFSPLAPAMPAPKFEVEVNWPVTVTPPFGEDYALRDSDWVQTSPAIWGVLGIVRYALVDRGENPDGLVIGWTRYHLHFTNTMKLRYRFYDEEPDFYENNTWLLRNHMTTYNSKSPRIVKIAAW